MDIRIKRMRLSSIRSAKWLASVEYDQGAYLLKEIRQQDDENSVKQVFMGFECDPHAEIS